MWRLTLGRLCRRSMMKSWPFGFSPMAPVDRGTKQAVVGGRPQRLA